MVFLFILYKLYYYIGCRRELVFIYLFILSPERKEGGKVGGGENRERERESERQREKHWCERNIHPLPPVRTLTRNRICMCLDLDLNLWPFGIGDDAPSSWTTPARPLTCISNQAVFKPSKAIPCPDVVSTAYHSEISLCIGCTDGMELWALFREQEFHVEGICRGQKGKLRQRYNGHWINYFFLS